MRLTAKIFERLPQVWILVGLLIIATGLYLGFDYSMTLVYLGIGMFSFVYGVALFVLQFLDGTGKSSVRPLSRDFISIGTAAVMPASQADQESSSS